MSRVNEVFLFFGFAIVDKLSTSENVWQVDLSWQSVNRSFVCFRQACNREFSSQVLGQAGSAGVDQGVLEVRELVRDARKRRKKGTFPYQERTINKFDERRRASSQAHKQNLARERSISSPRWSAGPQCRHPRSRSS